MDKRYIVPYVIASLGLFLGLYSALNVPSAPIYVLKANEPISHFNASLINTTDSAAYFEVIGGQGIPWSNVSLAVNGDHCELYKCFIYPVFSEYVQLNQTFTVFGLEAGKQYIIQVFATTPHGEWLEVISTKPLMYGLICEELQLW